MARSGTIAAEQLPLPEDQAAEKAFADFEKNWNGALLELKDEKDADGSLRQPSLLKVTSHSQIHPVLQTSLDSHTNPTTPFFDPAAPLQVLIRTYGKSILLAGFYKLLWSIFVIMVRPSPEDVLLPVSPLSAHVPYRELTISPNRS